VLTLGEPDRAELVELNRGVLRLWCWGDPAAPPVIFVHGAYDHGRMFDELAPRVADLGYHAVAVDLRGHGDSSPLHTGWAWTLMQLDLALLARRLLADTAHDTVGFVAHSMGGGQACGVAGTFPELVRWIVNIDALGPPPAAFDSEVDFAEMLERSWVAVDRARGPRREWASVDEMATRRGKNNPRLPPRWAAHLAVHGSRPGSDGGYVWKADPSFGIGFPGPFDIAALEAELRRVQCPVLVLTGTEPDMWRDLSDDEVADRVSWFRDVRHVVVPGTGHYVHIEDPDSTVRHIENFLAEVGP
jgi:pimeloyl-ACP methyl ester carboxylesterase